MIKTIHIRIISFDIRTDVGHNSHVIISLHHPFTEITKRIMSTIHEKGFPGNTSGKEPTCQCRRHKRHGFNPWDGKIPWRRKW